MHLTYLLYRDIVKYGLSLVVGENVVLKKNRHAVYKLQFHLIVATKYGYPVINEEISQRLKEIAKRIFECSWKCKILKIEIEKYYIHISFEGNPQTQLSNLINNFKTVSSRLIRKEFKSYLKKYYWKDSFWSPSYCLLSGESILVNVIDECVNDISLPKKAVGGRNE